MTTTTAPHAEEAQAITTTRPKVENVLLLGKSADWWNGAMLMTLGLAAFVAFMVVAASTGAVVATKRENGALKLQIAQLENSTARAREETEKIRALVRWRTISPDDAKALLTELSKGGGEIDMAFVPSDPESKYFALKIIGNDGFSAVNDASGIIKWRVHLRPSASNGMFFGIAIPGPENDQVKFLRHAFSAAHIEFSTGDPPEEVSPIAVGQGLVYTPPPKHEALIVIGLKQPPL